MADSNELLFDFSKVDLNKAAADLGQVLRDGAYTAIGLGVLGFQRAQVRRVELTKQLEGWLDQAGWLDQGGWSDQISATGDAPTARTQLSQLARTLDERVQPVRHRFDEQFDLIEQYLPPAARSLLQSLRAAAVEPEQRLRSVVGLD